MSKQVRISGISVEETVGLIEIIRIRMWQLHQTFQLKKKSNRIDFWKKRKRKWNRLCSIDVKISWWKNFRDGEREGRTFLTLVCTRSTRQKKINFWLGESQILKNNQFILLDNFSFKTNQTYNMQQQGTRQFQFENYFISVFRIKC